MLLEKRVATQWAVGIYRKCDVYTTSAMHKDEWTVPKNKKKSIGGRRLSVCSGPPQINECMGNIEGLLLAPFHQ